MKNSKIFIPGLVVLLFFSLTIFNSCEEEAGLTQEDLLKLEIDYQKQKDSLSYLKYLDSLTYQRYLDSLDRLESAKMDSLMLVQGKGNVTYTVLVADGGIASGDIEGGRTEESARFAAGVEVTVSQFGMVFSQTTGPDGLAVFDNMVKGEVLGHAFVTDFTPVSWSSDITPCAGCYYYYYYYHDSYGGYDYEQTHEEGLTPADLDAFYNVGNIIYVFPTTGANTSVIEGIATIETDLTNDTRELAPEGTEITAVIDVNHTDFDSRFVEESTTGTGTGTITHITYENAIVEATVQADGSFSMVVPAAAMGLPMNLYFSDVVEDQMLYEENSEDITTETYRTIFSAEFTAGQVSSIPAGGAPVIAFNGGSGATATAVIGSGAVIDIQITNGGQNFNGTPMVVIAAPNVDPTIGTTATATATITAGVVTDITIVDGGSGYASAPTVTITEGTGAAISVGAFLQSTTNGNIQAINVINGGSEYVDPPYVIIPAPDLAGGTQAVATAAINASGSVEEIIVSNSGGGYTANPNAGVYVTSGQGATATATADLGQGATATAVVVGGVITEFTITNGGSGYINPPNVVVTDGTGSGVVATAVLLLNAVDTIIVTNGGTGYSATPVVNLVNPNLGEIDAITLVDGGEYYTTTPIVTIEDAPVGGTTATATATLDPVDSVLSLTLTDPGSGYIASPLVTITAVGSGATDTVIWTGLGIASYNITNPGQDYINTPILVVSDPTYMGPNSAVAQLTPVMSGNMISGVTVVDPGLGYYPGETYSVTIVAGTGATAAAQIAGNSVIAMSIATQGSGYITAPEIEITGGGGSGATATATITNGHVTAIDITSGGAGYTSAPTVTFLDPTGATAKALVTDGVITAINILRGGQNYLDAPLVTITSTRGHSAMATAVVANGQVVSVTVDDGGTGYIQGNTPGAAEIFSLTPGPDGSNAYDVISNQTLIRDAHYGTGSRRPQYQ